MVRTFRPWRQGESGEALRRSAACFLLSAMVLDQGEAESTAEEESAVEEEGGGQCYNGGDDEGYFLHAICI